LSGRKIHTQSRIIEMLLARKRLTMLLIAFSENSPPRYMNIAPTVEISQKKRRRKVLPER
jgi:hypothetical protein